MTNPCPGCGAFLAASDSACRLCGMPAVEMDKHAGTGAERTDAIEPEVLESLEEVERSSGSRPRGGHRPFGQYRSFGQESTVRPMGCSLGPGCGCIGLPLAALAGAVVSALMVVLWLLSLGRVPVSIVRMVQRLRRGGGHG